MKMILWRKFVICVYFFSVTLFGFFLRLNDLIIDLSYQFTVDDSDGYFDYIVVGAGSAGSIIAKKLADNNEQVLILEAGKNVISLLNIPSIGLLLQQTPYDWNYKTVPQQNACLGLEKNMSIWPMGKMVGGTSMLNNMIYVRGHERDFQEWFKDKGGYKYSDILSYFKEIEHILGKDDTVDSKGHISLSDVIYQTELFPYIMKAAEILGYPILKETYSCQIGVGPLKANLFGGERDTSARRLANSHKNLLLKSNSFVEKVLFRSNFEAYGVEYSFLGKKYRVFAKKAVILSAGVIGTPKILMLSGIGNRTHLMELGVSVIADLPVGLNLQDHVATGPDLILLNRSLSLSLESMLKPSSLVDYFGNGSGPWTTTGCEALAYFKTDSVQPIDRPNLQFMILPLGINEDDGYYLRKLMGISDHTWSSYFSKIEAKTMTILPVLLHPKSRGTIRLASIDPTVSPLIDPRYLTESEDVEAIVKGIRLIQHMTDTEAFKELGAEFNRHIFADCSSYEFDSDQYWECYIRHLTITAYHPVGTCKMGRNKDSSTVVDFNFQVKNTNRLFVVDASVLPSSPSGNINGPVMMMAAMAADEIQKYYYASMKKSNILDLIVPRHVC